MKKLLGMILVVSCVATSMNFSKSVWGRKEQALRELFGGIDGDLPDGISKRVRNSRKADRNHKGAFRKYRRQSQDAFSKHKEQALG